MGNSSLLLEIFLDIKTCKNTVKLLIRIFGQKIERSLEKSSQDELSTSSETCEKANHVAATTTSARPKNHSSTSLPNVAELLAESGSSGENPLTAQDDAAAKRPPRHVKTASLPRDTSLCAPQVWAYRYFSIIVHRNQFNALSNSRGHSIRRKRHKNIQSAKIRHTFGIDFPFKAYSLRGAAIHRKAPSFYPNPLRNFAQPRKIALNLFTCSVCGRADSREDGLPEAADRGGRAGHFQSGG